MTLKEHFVKNITLALPVMMSQVGHMLVSLADSVMVGQLGTVPLASVSLASGVFAVILLLGIGISYGMTPMVARADGSDNAKQAGAVLTNGLLLNSIVGIVLVAVCLIVVRGFVYLDQDPNVLKGAIPFFEISGWSILPLMIFQTFRQFTEGLSLTKQAMMISISGNLLNVALNYCLIYGVLGFPELGLLGAAWSTLITRVIMACSMSGYVIWHSRFKIHRQAFALSQISKAMIKEIFRIGLPSGIQFVFEVGAFSAAAVMTGWLGASALAAHQIALNLSAITYMAATGLSAAGAIRIGNQLGKKDFHTMRMAGYTSILTAGLLMLLFGVNFILGREFYPKIYIDEPEVIAMASGLLIIAALFQISDGVQAVGLGVLRGLSDVKIPTIVTFLAYWVVAIPAAYWLGITLGYGIDGIWIGLLMGLTIAAIAHVIRFHQVASSYLRS